MQVEKEHLVGNQNYSFPVYTCLLICQDCLPFIFTLPDAFPKSNQTIPWSSAARLNELHTHTFMKGSPISFTSEQPFSSPVPLRIQLFLLWLMRIIHLIPNKISLGSSTMTFMLPLLFWKSLSYCILEFQLLLPCPQALGQTVKNLSVSLLVFGRFSSAASSLLLWPCSSKTFSSCCGIFWTFLTLIIPPNFVTLIHFNDQAPLFSKWVINENNNNQPTLRLTF